MFYVGGKLIDFVSSFPHLGHVITDTLDDGRDITKRLGNFIGRSTTYYVSLVRCPLMLRHVCLEHTALAIRNVNCGICQPAVCLLSVRRGAKVSGVYGTYHTGRTVIYCHFCAIVYRYLTKYVEGRRSFYKRVCFIIPHLFALFPSFL